jgi:hypothetical protein
MAEFKPGMLVYITTKPEWGPGKIVHISGDTLHIVFRDLEEPMAKKIHGAAPNLQIAAQQSDPILDNLPPLIEKNGGWVFQGKRRTLGLLMRDFQHEFPAGFSDPKYFEEERTYKLDLHITFQKLLGIEQLRQLLDAKQWRALAGKAEEVLTEVNMLFKTEHAAFHDARKDDAAVERFFRALLLAIDSPLPSKESMEPLFDATCALPAPRGRVATWTVATVFPFLADPQRFMFLKPEVTKEAAKTFQFELHYDSTPNWTTYDALSRMGRIYLELLKPMGARDFVDVQSFIYVTCGGYENARAMKAKGNK